MTELRKKTNIFNYFKSQKESASDVFNKNEYLERVTPKNGLGIYKYPSGTPLAVIEKVYRAISSKNNLNGFNYLPIKTSHGFLFHLVRNESADHSFFEKKEKISGGINSDEVQDIGEFRIAEIINGDIEDYADFSLYKTKDDFEIRS